MNTYDTEVARGLLHHKGYDIMLEGDGESIDKMPSYHQADVILMNTCSVRDHAEQRVLSRLGLLAEVKKERPELIVGLMGCMVEEHREKLFRRFPQLDLMVGTRNISELPGLIDKVSRERGQVSRIKQDGISIEYSELIQRSSEHHAWLPVMTGCNKVCTFCIVPITRGSEVSMKARDVYREASRLVSEGVKWVTLLGQNVNSYRGEEEAGAPRQGFPELLEMLCEIEGLERISFTTSHPQDATPELYDVIRRNPKISRRFHLPLQSGSDNMLKRMKRLHSYEEFKGKIRLMRETIPDISITTDIIAGFSGETEDDHEQTMQALKELRFDGAYIYKYSLRPGTPAAKLADDVPHEVKKRRNAELLELQKVISRENHESWIGRKINVFVEDRGTRNAAQWICRSDQERRVVFEAADNVVRGSFVPVELKSLSGETFIAEPV